MKKTLTAAAAIAMVATTASAVEVELYGQVNKGLFGYDDGSNTDMVVVDNARDSTRFGFKGAQALDNGLTASVLFETEMQSNASDAFAQNNNSPTGATSATPASNGGTFAERQARVGLSGNFGGVYLGQQSTAIDGVFVQDLAGANDVMGADVREIGGALLFRNESTNALTATNVNALGFAMDENRADSIRYDSPIFNGFQGRASIAQGGDMDMSVFYDGGIADVKVVGAVGAYFNNDTTDGAANTQETTYSASVSAKHSSGLGATLAYASSQLTNETTGADDPTQWYAKVGYAWDAFEVAADYSSGENWNSPAAYKDEMTAMGLAAQYNLADGVSVAALYRNFDAEVKATSAAVGQDNIDLYGVNMKVRF